MSAISSDRRKLFSLLLQEKGVARASRQVIPRRNGVGPWHLSFAQQRFWFLEQLESGSAAYSVPVAVRLTGELNVAALGEALSEVVRRHEVLRTTFGTVDGQPVQVVSPPQPLAMPLMDLRLVEESRREKEAHRVVAAEAGRPFNLEKGPLLRATLLQLGKQEHVALLNMHHIISDAWSRGVLVNELGKLYEQFNSGVEAGLGELPLQYADYAVWQREWLQGEVLEKQLSYWKEQLKEVPAVIDLPLDRPRPPVQTTKGASYSFKLSQSVSEELKALSRAEGATLFMLFLAGFQALLHRYTRQSQINVGTPIAGRNRAETEGLIGCFINTLVLKSEVRSEESFRSFLGRVKETCLGAYAHQDLPFEKLVDELGVERSLSHSPLFQVMFLMQNTPRVEMQLSGVTLSPFEVERTTAKFDLLLLVDESEDGLSACFEYNTDLFEPATIERLSRHYTSYLQGIVANPNAQFFELPLLSEEEQRGLLDSGHGPARSYPAGECVHQLFEQQVMRTPGEIAVVCEGEQVSYGELNARANQVAHYLCGRGVGPESRVGVLLGRTAEFPVALLAVLKAGGAYVALDPAYPEERLRFMLEDSAAAAVITDRPLPLEEKTAAVIRLDLLAEELKSESEANLGVKVDAENLSHVIYTSGSTGRPKGVMITHGSTCQLLRWTRDEYTDKELSGVLFSTSACFDLSVFELFGPLSWGGRVVLVDDALGLMELHIDAEVRLVNTVPSAMAELLRMNGVPASVVTINLAGEALPDRLVRALHDKGIRRVCNLYGPTEDTTYSTWTEVGRDERVTLGRSVSNSWAYVLDPWMRVLPVGVVGELYLGGAGLARGYWKRAGMTAERFVPDPFSEAGGERLYRTGDLVKYLADGRLEYVGRMDQQVKLRGFRIELGEVEAVLSQHAGVREVVAMVRGEGVERKQLVAYVVANGEGEISGGELRRYLSERVPEYLVPGQFVMLEELPLTPNGKVDRKALPSPEAVRAEANEDKTAPRTKAEEVLCAIWQEVLGLERIGVEENFFELGGDSILSIQVVSRAARRGLRLMPRQLFQHQTIASLAGAALPVVGVSRAAGGEETESEAPLTPIQRWFFERVKEHREHWNQAVLLELATLAADPAVLSKALSVVVRHHPSLRMRFTQAADGEWSQHHIGGDAGSSPLTVIDLDNVPDDENSRMIEQASRQAQSSLELERGRLMRAVLLSCGGGEPARLLVVIHHLVVDGVSWRVLLEDWQSAYEQLKSGRTEQEVELLGEGTSFTEWARRLEEFRQSEEMIGEGEYWQAVSASGVELLVDCEGGTNREGDAAHVTVQLTEEETEALLREVPPTYRTEVNDALLTALGRTLWRWTGERHPVVELEGHGREEFAVDLDVSRTVGWFTTMFPVELEAGAEIGEDLKRVKERLRRIPRRGLGYGLWRYGAERGGSSEVSGSERQLVFNYLGQLDSAVSGDSMFRPARESAGESMWSGGERSHLLMVNASVAGGQLTVTWSYSRQLHRRETVAQLAQWLSEELRALIAHCREQGAGGFTPSDFPAAQLSQAELDDFLASVN